MESVRTLAAISSSSRVAVVERIGSGTSSNRTTAPRIHTSSAFPPSPAATDRARYFSAEAWVVKTTEPALGTTVAAHARKWSQPTAKSSPSGTRRFEQTLPRAMPHAFCSITSGFTHAFFTPFTITGSGAAGSIERRASSASSIFAESRKATTRVRPCGSSRSVSATICRVFPPPVGAPTSAMRPAPRIAFCTDSATRARSSSGVDSVSGVL